MGRNRRRSAPIVVEIYTGCGRLKRNGYAEAGLLTPTLHSAWKRESLMSTILGRVHVNAVVHASHLCYAKIEKKNASFASLKLQAAQFDRVNQIKVH